MSWWLVGPVAVIVALIAMILADAWLAERAEREREAWRRYQRRGRR